MRAFISSAGQPLILCLCCGQPVSSTDPLDGHCSFSPALLWPHSFCSCLEPMAGPWTWCIACHIRGSWWASLPDPRSTHYGPALWDWTCRYGHGLCQCLPLSQLWAEAAAGCRVGKLGCPEALSLGDHITWCRMTGRTREPTGRTYNPQGSPRQGGTWAPSLSWRIPTSQGFRSLSAIWWCPKGEAQVEAAMPFRLAREGQLSCPKSALHFNSAALSHQPPVETTLCTLVFWQPSKAHLHHSLQSSGKWLSGQMIQSITSLLKSQVHHPQLPNQPPNRELLWFR